MYYKYKPNATPRWGEANPKIPLSYNADQKLHTTRSIKLVKIAFNEFD